MRKVILSATAILCLGLPAIAADDNLVGKELYDGYCAACHGAKGMGDGDMANVLTIPAPNLTQIAQRNGGEFPMLKVIHIIDGRSGMRAHGGPMPLWGDVFSVDPNDPSLAYTGEIMARGRALSLAEYLETLQAK